MLITQNHKYYYSITLILFLLSAFFGLLIRWNFAFPMTGFEYQGFLQGHSHVAFLGWGYLATIGAIMHYFIPLKKQKSKVYRWTITLILITIVLMLVSFPLTGYKVFSIVLLSVFGITSYVLSFRLLNDMKGNDTANKFVKFGIYYYLLSSLATWFLAIVLVTQGKTELYYNTVYFYLHFLYNGFFVFALFGVLFKILKDQGVLYNEKWVYNSFIYLNAACVPAFALSVLWSTESPIVYVIGFAASVLQVISLLFLLRAVYQISHALKWSRIATLLLSFLLIAYSLKIGMQLSSSIPYFVEKSLMLKPYFIIGYLHLFTLGILSVFLILILHQMQKINLNAVYPKFGTSLFLIGVICTEVLFFMQGFMLLFSKGLIPNYAIILCLLSAIIVLGLLILSLVSLKRNGLNTSN